MAEYRELVHTRHVAKCTVHAFLAKTWSLNGKNNDKKRHMCKVGIAGGGSGTSHMGGAMGATIPDGGLGAICSRIKDITGVFCS